ncbi:MAG TPA: DUF222 domain-containing protein, partial [Sporichthya sp.]|nr:DUF222 domain-containing protein [Sporichthya sp.]
AEVAFAFRLSKAEASDLLDLAMTLSRRLPATFAALKDGELGLRKVRAITEESENLTVAQCAELEKRVLPEAAARTVRSLRDKVRREVEKLDADAVRKRREAAIADRALYVKDEPDGMATLCLYLPAEQVRAIHATINARIPVHRTDPADDRKIAARRVDELVDVLAAAFGVDFHAVADTETPVLSAEQIARLNRGANTYTPSAAMKAAVRARDRHCRFPGCRRPAIHTDVDHTVAFGPDRWVTGPVGTTVLRIGGRTVYTNLGCLCRFHHQVKQMPGWSCSQDQAGVFTWIDPGRRVFLTRPPPPDGEEPPEFWAPEDTAADHFPF